MMDGTDRTDSGAALFEWLCLQGDLRGALRGLTRAQIIAVHDFLTRQAETGVPGVISDLVTLEAANRYLTPTP